MLKETNMAKGAKAVNTAPGVAGNPAILLAASIGKVYHGSPTYVKELKGVESTGRHDTDKGVFVSPYKGIAGLFGIDKQNIVDELQKRVGGHLTGLNIGYTTWNKPSTELNQLQDTIVEVNYPAFRPFSGKARGILYTIAYNKKLKSASKPFSKNKDTDREFIIDHTVTPETSEPYSIRYTVVPSKERISRFGSAVLHKS